MKLTELSKALGRIKSRGVAWTLPFLMLNALRRYIARKVRVFVFRHIIGLRLGKRVFLGPGIRLVQPRKIQLGDDTCLAERVRLWSESEYGTLVLGRNAQIDRNALIDFSGNLTIEDDVLISEEAVIYTHDHGRNPRSQPKFSSLLIGQGAWIGQRAFILPRVNYIGKNAVIGANAVVDRDIPDGATFVGAHGRLLPARNNDDVLTHEF